MVLLVDVLEGGCMMLLMDIFGCDLVWFIGLGIVVVVKVCSVDEM